MPDFAIISPVTGQELFNKKNGVKVSQTRRYKKTKCCNQQCINNGAPADYENPKCWLDPDNEKRVFCTPECGEFYLDNLDEIEKGNRVISKINTKKNRKIDELAEAIHIYSGQSFDKKILKKVIKQLNLSSPYV